jgi:hypothetical protein
MQPNVTAASASYVDVISCTTFQEQCRARDFVDQGFKIVQSGCYYLDWDRTWVEIYNAPLLSRECAPRVFADSETSAVFGAEASLWSERVRVS